MTKIIVTEVSFDTKGCAILSVLIGLASIVAIWIVELIRVYILGG